MDQCQNMFLLSETLKTTDLRTGKISAKEKTGSKISAKEKTGSCRA